MRSFTALLLVILTAACASSSNTAAAPRDDEEFAIESTVLAVYNVVSGPAGRRDWNRFEALFVPGAQLAISRTTEPAPLIQSVKDYIASATPTFNEKGWFERPIATRVMRYGNVAQVWSTYEGRERSNDERPAVRGINSFQLVKIGSDWKVASWAWQKEDAALPVPAEYLKAR